MWLLCGYEVVGGALFGFPKYQIPSMPLICLGIALAWKDMWKFKPLRRDVAVHLVILGLLSWILLMKTGDPLHAMRIDVRETAVKVSRAHVEEGSKVRNRYLGLQILQKIGIQFCHVKGRRHL